MAVILETSLGDITIDLYTEERPQCCKNFLKLCKVKYYNWCLFHSVQRNYIAQTGDPTGTGRGGHSIFSKLYGEQAQYFEMETKPRIKHSKLGSVSMVNGGNNMHGSQFFITLGADLDYLDGKHTVFGEVAEGENVLEKINEAIADKENRPYKDIRIFHTVVLDDPYDDPAGLADLIPDRSPRPTQEMLQSDRIGVDEDVDIMEGMTTDQVEQMLKEKESKANAQLLEMVGDLPDVDVKPPDDVLFVCKLNPVTTSEDLEVIFSRFGNIVSCEVIKDQKTGESLQYAFIEFEKESDCENAYFKMDNVLIDDRRIHVDFSQSVSKVKWKGKGKGVTYPGKDKEEDDGRPKYVIKDNSMKDQRYDLVFDEEDSPSSSKKHKKKKKKRRHSSSDSHSDSDTKKHKKQGSKRSRSRSPVSQSRNRSPDERRDRAKHKDRNPDKYRDREPDKYRDREPDKYRDRDYNKRKDRDSDRRREKSRDYDRRRDR